MGLLPRNFRKFTLYKHNLPRGSVAFLILIFFSSDVGRASGPPDSDLISDGDDMGDRPGDMLAGIDGDCVDLRSLKVVCFGELESSAFSDFLSAVCGLDYNVRRCHILLPKSPFFQ